MDQQLVEQLRQRIAELGERTEIAAMIAELNTLKTAWEVTHPWISS
jgi:hypothetical protein